MTKKSFFLLGSFLFCGVSFGQSTDSIASRVFEEKILIIETSLANNSRVFAGEIQMAVTFLRELTGIDSESGGDYIGPYPPTKNDLWYWKKWFRINKNNISWDPKRKAIILHKIVLVEDR